MNNDFATADEIKIAHELILPGKQEFEQDKISVIQCNESRDIQACPGSGKTTTLLAKLAILANRMPFKDGSGICVLTHTNVAIDEIKSRFGKYSSVLLNYPNFCGTIQSFVDQFLAIPYFNSICKKGIVAIDDDRAKSIINNAFYNTSWPEQRSLNHCFKENKEYLEACKQKNWVKVQELKVNLVKESFYDFHHRKFFRKYGENKAIAAATKIGETSDTFKFFTKVRLSSVLKGIIEYQDAYSCGTAYSMLLPISESLSERFRYLFIDEMQDSDQIQIDLLNRIFDRSRLIMQCFGDSYQSIYGSSDMNTCLWTPINPLRLNSSKRFGESIAKVLRTVCIEDNNSLQGNPEINSVKPIMLVYDTSDTVLPAFVKILKTTLINDVSIADIAKEEREKDPLKRHNIKAIAYVGKKKEDSIHQYFPNFDNNVSGSKRPFSTDLTLNDFLMKINVEDKPSSYRSQILDAIVVAIDRAGIKTTDGRRYTKTSFLNWLKYTNTEIYNSLLINLSNWIITMSESPYNVDKNVFEGVKQVIEELIPLCNKDVNIGIISSFLAPREASFYTAKSSEQSSNIYCDGDVDIEIATVHSVKGETHIATLYLETKYHKYESEHFGPQLCGVPYVPRNGDSFVKSALKVAYVGMSRPKLLLCYAIKAERFDQLDTDKLKNIWDIHKIKTCDGSLCIIKEWNKD